MSRLPWLAGIAALAAAPIALAGFHLGLLTEVLILGLFAMSLDLQLGYARMVSFGHAGPYGVGAFAAALLMAKAGWPLPCALAGAVAITAVVAVPVGWLCCRAGGVAFAMLTLAFAQLAYAVAYKWQSLTGGSDGLAGVPRVAGPFGLELFTGRVGYYALTVALVGSALLAARAFVASPMGRALVAVRENEARAEALGFDPRRLRLAAFVLSNALAGLAGALYAGHVLFVSPELLLWTVSGHVLVMVILGGTGTLFGPFLGAAAFLMLEHEVSALTESWALILGFIFIVTVIVMPEGMWGLGARLLRGARRPPAVEPRHAAP
ncbi:MAG: branched-chain amino acid ABC transporter permease [Alphaproteobacteria bacterium]|nr:branched-chain amino acid ABC transporter permease [Alphaproteobacteria bacterium]